MLNFSQVARDDIKTFQLIENWVNSEDIRYHIRPNFSEAEIKPAQAESMLRNYRENEGCHLFIFEDGKKVGYVEIDFNFGSLFGSAERCGWISICIGEADCRGKGYGLIALDFMEKFAQEQGCKRLELGVFAFNHQAERLYQKAGFQKIGRIENFVYYDKGWHDDIRMEKWL